MSRTTTADTRADFTRFVGDAEPRLRRALVALRGTEDGREATAEALGWAWEHWSDVQAMENPIGYLYRVGSSRTRPRRRALLPVAVPESHRFEPGLGRALGRLPEKQRTAVVLVHGCGWTYEETALAMGLTKSSVGTHVERAMKKLRRQLGVEI